MSTTKSVSVLFALLISSSAFAQKIVCSQKAPKWEKSSEGSVAKNVGTVIVVDLDEKTVTLAEAKGAKNNLIGREEGKKVLVSAFTSNGPTDTQHIQNYGISEMKTAATPPQKKISYSFEFPTADDHAKINISLLVFLSNGRSDYGRGSRIDSEEYTSLYFDYCDYLY